jgi:hypothetical protein
MAVRTSTSLTGGVIARSFLNKAIFSTGVRGAALVRTSLLLERATLELGFGLQTLNHTVVEIANQNLSHPDLPRMLSKRQHI